MGKSPFLSFSPVPIADYTGACVRCDSWKVTEDVSVLVYYMRSGGGSDVMKMMHRATGTCDVM